jgi:PAS domain S-box-containing protein/putative nucleotidyltransferase with HDIG domain
MAEQMDIDFLRERDRHAEALLALSRRIEGAHTERDAFEAAFDILRTHTGYRHYWVFVLDEDARHAHFYMGGKGPESNPATATLTIPGDPMMEEIATSRDIVVVEDARTDPRTNKEIVARVGNLTIINVPILFNARNLGAVGTGTFGDEGIRLPTPAERDFLKAVASHLAISLDRLHNRNEWQRAEKELQAGEARYRSLVLAMAEGVIFQDLRGVITAANPAAERILGRPEDSLLGSSSLAPEAIRGDDGAPIPAEELPWAITMATGTSQADVVLGVRKPDGGMAWLSINTRALDGDVAQAPYAVVTTFRDVTEQRQVRQQLEMLRVALDCSSDSVFMMEGERVLQVNRGACTSLGHAAEELVGKSLYDFDPAMRPERMRELIESSLRTNRIVFESCHRAKDGRVFPVEVDVTPFLFDGRHLAMALTRDITERKKNEDAMRRLNRTLLTLSSGNEALVRAGSEAELLDRMCRILVEVGGHRAVWIDLNRHPNDNELFPAAVASVDDSIPLDPRRVPHGKGLAAALSSGTPELIEDIDCDGLAECRADLLRIGCRSGLVLPLLANQGLIGALSIFAENAEAFDRAELDLLKELADDLAFGIQAQRTHVEQKHAVTRLRQTMEATILALANTLELRDPYTAGHQRRVANLAKAIARRLGLDDERAEVIYLAGMIHDIGKIYVPSEVLTRPGRLTPLEYSLVQTHVEAAYAILQPIEFPWPLAEIIYQHHERLDGTGYPRGCRGDDISLDARILAVADVVEAMSAHRPYRPGLGIDAALAEIVASKGRTLDPGVVDGCVALFRTDGFQFE